MGLDLNALRGNGIPAKPAEKPQGDPIADKQGEAIVAGPETVESQAEPEVAKKLYTSAPVMSLKLGKFQFTRGVLTLDDPTDIEQFDKLLKTLPPRERNAIRTISVELAEAMVRPIEPGVTRAFDSSVNRQQDRVGGQDVVGTVALDAPHRTESRDDMNIAENEGQGTGDSTTQQS